MSTTIALYNRPTRTHRGLATYRIECGAAVERALFQENGVDADELAFVIRRRGARLPYGHNLHAYYSPTEQETHRKVFNGAAYGDGYCLTTGKFALECDHCWTAADHDWGEEWT